MGRKSHEDMRKYRAQAAKCSTRHKQSEARLNAIWDEMDRKSTVKQPHRKNWGGK